MSGYRIKLFNSKEYINARVKVYRNLHNGLMSVSHYIKGKGWRLAGHTSDLFLTDCSFVVHEGGRQRVLAEKRKNVHAYVTGIVKESFEDSVEFGKFGLVTYNPYYCDSFLFKKSKKPITFAKYCLIQQCKVFALVE
jgi:hypothetical protein